MKELFKNKLFIIISLFIILVTFISSSCFAFGDSVEINYPSDIFSENIKGFILSSNNTNIDLWTFDSSSYIDSLVEENNSSQLKVFVPSNTSVLFYRYNFDTNSFNLLNQSSFTDAVVYSIYTNSHPILFYNVDNPNNISVPIAETPTLVFLGAPQVTPVEVEQVTIPAIQQVEEIPQGMNQVLQVIIPIGLMVLPIGLVVYLTRLVIYLMQS